jgi:hypothetical protein
MLITHDDKHCNPIPLLIDGLLTGKPFAQRFSQGACSISTTYGLTGLILN